LRSSRLWLWRMPSLRYKDPVITLQETHHVSITELSRLMPYKVWGFHGGDYEECRFLGYKNPVLTSQEAHYVSASELNRLMLCKIWGFHCGNYEECRLLGYTIPVLTSEETHYVSTTETSWLMMCKMWGFHGCGKKMTSSAMWPRGALVRTDVSEDNISSIIMLDRISELGTTLAETSNWITLRRQSSLKLPHRWCNQTQMNGLYYAHTLTALKERYVAVSCSTSLIRTIHSFSLRGFNVP
jgi:hypothetical protein